MGQSWLGAVYAIYAAVQLQCQPLATAHSLISTLPPPTGCTFQFNCRNTFTPFTYAIIRHYTTRQSLIHYGRLCVYVARKVAKVIAGFPGRALTPPVVVYIIKHLIYWQSFLACECASSTVPCHAMPCKWSNFCFVPCDLVLHSDSSLAATQRERGR